MSIESNSPSRKQAQGAGLLVGGLAALSVVLAFTACPAAWAQTAYCNITDIKVNHLTNGVQVVVTADGALWAREIRQGNRQSIQISFPGARSLLGKNFFDVNTPPVSSILVTTSQGAEMGLGLDMNIALTEAAGYDTELSADKLTYIVTVFGKLTVEGQRNGNGGGGDTEAEMSVEVRDGKLYVRARKADIHGLVAQIARASGLNVAVDNSVQHKVSLSIEAASPKSVIQAIASGYGLAISQVGDVEMLSGGVPTDLPSYNRSATASFPLRYLKADAAAGLLPGFLYKYLNVNNEQNAVVVTAPTQMLDKISSDLKQVDKAPPLIMIEAIAVEITDTNAADLNLNWAYGSPTEEFGVNNQTGDIGYRTGDLDVVSSSVALTPTLAGRLRAILESGRARIKASPRMAAVNGRSAEIFIGSQRFILVTYLRSGVQQERIESIPVGVRLNVKPWTGGNNEITTEIEVEVSNIRQIDPATGLPLLSTRRAKSTVRAGNNETIVIAGLCQEQEEVTRRKVPILGDIPVIGWIFRSQARSTINSQLVIFITPRILNPGGLLPDMEGERGLRERFLTPDDPGYELDEEPAEAPTG